MPLQKLAEYLPSEATKRVRHNRGVSERVAGELLASQIAAFESGDESGVDLASVMGKKDLKLNMVSHAHIRSSPRKCLVQGFTEDELGRDAVGDPIFDGSRPRYNGPSLLRFGSNLVLSQ